MCDIPTNTRKIPKALEKKIEHICKGIEKCEMMILKIKAMKFENFQSFDFVHKNFDQGEVYAIDNVGYTVITKKTLTEVCFVVIMKLNNIWEHHFQDVDKHLVIKQGVYMDLYTGEQYNKELKVKAFDPSYFQAVGNEDLIIKGRVYKE